MEGLAFRLGVQIAIWLLTSVVPPGADIKTELVVQGLSLPVGFAQDPTDPAVQYILEQGGRVRILDDGVLQSGDFLDLTSVVGCCGERGLLGIAFPPDHAETGRFYVNFTNTSGDTVVARFSRSTLDPGVGDPGSRFDLRWPSGDRFIDQPDSNHNGGNLAFGPDGFLYIGMGDGGSANDPGHRAQDPTTLLGKMLRIDVSVPDNDPNGYRIPPDNPFLDGQPVSALGEIWAFGLRNPWRFSFDDPNSGGTGALVVADVGQGQWEEINYEPAGEGGRNYGWRNREGAHDNVTSPGPSYGPLTDPVSEYDHTVGRSITGGYVYRGGALPTHYLGEYFYSDYVNGRVWSLSLDIDPVTGEATALDDTEHTGELGGPGVLGNISAMGTDAAGELYILNYSDGTLLRIVAAASPEDLFVDFGESSGLWERIEGRGWNQIHSLSPLGIVTADPDGNGRDDLIADFGSPYGIWIWANDSAWMRLHSVSGEAILSADLDGDGVDEVVTDFGSPYGIWARSRDGFWFQLHHITPRSMVAADMDGDGTESVVADFGRYGIWAWSTGAWFQIHQTSPEAMARADLDGDGTEEVIVDFGTPYGIYVLWNGAWVQLHQTSSRSIIPADLNGDGIDEVVIDFRAPYGVWAWRGGAWVQIHQNTPESMVAVDLDGDGADEVAIDFGSPWGVWAWSDLTGWRAVHPMTPAAMATGSR